MEVGQDQDHATEMLLQAFRVYVGTNPVAHITYFGQKDCQCPEELLCQLPSSRLGMRLKQATPPTPPPDMKLLSTNVDFTVSNPKGSVSRDLRAMFLAQELSLQ